MIELVSLQVARCVSTKFPVYIRAPTGALPLDDRALGLAEPLRSIATGGVRQVDRRADLNVVAVRHNPALVIVHARCHLHSTNLERIHIRQGNVPDFDIILCTISIPFLPHLAISASNGQCCARILT